MLRGRRAAGGGRRAAGGAGRRARRWRDVRGVRRALLANLILTWFGSGLRVLSFCQLRQALGDVCRMRETREFTRQRMGIHYYE